MQDLTITQNSALTSRSIEFQNEVLGFFGGVVGGLIGLGIPEIEAKRYEEKLKSGNYLIAVHAQDDDQENRAKEIFEAAGAEDITTSSMSKVPAAAD